MASVAIQINMLKSATENLAFESGKNDGLNFKARRLSAIKLKETALMYKSQSQSLFLSYMAGIKSVA